MAYPLKWAPKYLTEVLCNQQTFAPDDHTRDAMQQLLDVLWMHRPIGANGKHGNGDLCTPTCGCED